MRKWTDAMRDRVRRDYYIAAHIVSRHVRKAIAHPHHYATAFACCVTLFLLGHSGAAEMVGFWLYALFENLLGEGGGEA